MKCKLCCPFPHTHFKNCLKHDRALACNRDTMRRAPGSATRLVLPFIKRFYSPDEFLRTHDRSERTPPDTGKLDSVPRAHAKNIS